MQGTTIDDGLPKKLLQICRLASSVDARVVEHQNFVVNQPASLYHHLAERNKGCSRAIVFANGIDRVGEFPRIAAYAGNHVIGILEVATHR